MIGPIPALAELARLREQLDAFGARLAQLSPKSVARWVLAALTSQLEGTSRSPNCHGAEVIS